MYYMHTKENLICLFFAVNRSSDCLLELIGFAARLGTDEAIAVAKINTENKSPNLGEVIN